LGATAGDFFDKPIGDGGLQSALASAIIAAFIVTCAVGFPQRPGVHSATTGKV
jgi:uncharacterized membrane-anchored protein